MEVMHAIIHRGTRMVRDCEDQHGLYTMNLERKLHWTFWDAQTEHTEPTNSKDCFLFEDLPITFHNTYVSYRANKSVLLYCI